MSNETLSATSFVFITPIRFHFPFLLMGDPADFKSLHVGKQAEREELTPEHLWGKRVFQVVAYAPEKPFAAF